MGNRAERDRAALILSETSLEEVQASMTDSAVKNEVRDQLQSPNRPEILELKRQGKIKPDLIVDEPAVSGVFHRLSMKKSRVEAQKKIAAEKEKDPVRKAEILRAKQNPPPALVSESDKKTFNTYKKWHNKLFNQWLLNVGFGGIDTLLGWLGMYYCARGFFCVNAQSEYAKAQHIVDILEKVPELEERLS